MSGCFHDGPAVIHDGFTILAHVRVTHAETRFRFPIPRMPPMPETNNNEKGIVRIELTSEQKEQVKEITKKSAEAIELTVEELEQRIAPIMMM